MSLPQLAISVSLQGTSPSSLSPKQQSAQYASATGSIGGALDDLQAAANTSNPTLSLPIDKPRPSICP